MTHIVSPYLPIFGIVAKPGAQRGPAKEDLVVKSFLEQNGVDLSQTGQSVQSDFANHYSDSKYAWSGQISPDMAVWEDAYYATLQHMQQCVGGWKEVSLEQVMEEINPTASAMFPFVGRRKGEILKDPRWVPLFLDLMENWMTYLTPVYSDFLKVEILDLDKVVDRRTRTISGPNVMWLVFQMINEMDYAHRMREFGEKHLGEPPGCFFAKGFTFTHGGWKYLYDTLNAFESTVEVDFSEYDGLLSVMMKLIPFRIRVDTYGGRDPLMRLKLWLIYYNDIYNYILTMNGVVYSKKCGTNSGTYTTSDDGTVIHIHADFYVRIRAQYRLAFFTLILADDAVIGIDAWVDFVRYYIEVGLWGKKVTWRRGADGIGFLGAVLTRDGVFYDWGTLCKSLVTAYHGLSQQVVLSKIINIAALCWFDKPKYQLLKDLYYFIVEARQWSQDPAFPADFEFHELWNESQESGDARQVLVAPLQAVELSDFDADLVDF